MLHKFLLIIETDSLSCGKDYEQCEENDLNRYITEKLEEKTCVIESFKATITHIELIPA